MVFKTEQVCVNQQNLTWLTFALLMPIAGCWHSLFWYFDRVQSSLEEAVGLVVILAILVFFCIKSLCQSRMLYKFPLWPVACLLTVYGMLFLVPVPDIIRTAVAFVLVCGVLYVVSFGVRPSLTFWLLVIISLPVVPSLQFYLGYPARYLSASLTVPLLQLNGLSVTQRGTYLVWNELPLQFDAPCSGVVMLWGGLFLSLIIAFFYRFNYWQTAVSLLVAVLFILAGNVLRASSLFYLEIGGAFVNETWLHEGVGVVCFLLAGAGVVTVLSRLRKWCSL